MKIRPMLAKSSNPFDSENHIFELKWDGTRCIAFVDKSHLRLQNRRLLDITYRYPEFQELRKYLKVKSAVFDGEIVVLKEGIPNFEKLQQREHTAQSLFPCSVSNMKKITGSLLHTNSSRAGLT